MSDHILENGQEIIAKQAVEIQQLKARLQKQTEQLAAYRVWATSKCGKALQAWYDADVQWRQQKEGYEAFKKKVSPYRDGRAHDMTDDQFNRARQSMATSDAALQYRAACRHRAVALQRLRHAMEDAQP